MSKRFRIKHFLKGFRSYTTHHLELRNNVWLGSFYPELQAALFAENAGVSVDYHDIYDQTLLRTNRSKATNSIDRMVDNYVNFYLHDDILVKVDRASMMHSLEVRAPFLDTAFAEFVCRLPSNMKMNGFTRKYLLKKMAERKVPSAIVHRPKKGFGIPLAAWFKGPLRGLLFDTFSESHLRQEGLFNSQWIGRFINDFLYKNTNTAKEIWNLFVLEIWRQQHKV